MISRRRYSSVFPFNKHSTPNKELPVRELPLFSQNQSKDSFPSLSSPPLAPVISDQSFSFGESEGGRSIDLIQGDNCSKTEREGLRAFLVSLKELVREEEEGEKLLFTAEAKRALWRVAVRGWKEIRSPNKLLRAYKRLLRSRFCGSSGHLLVGMRGGEIVEFKRATHSCRSVLCPYCQNRESRKRLSKVIGWFKREIERGSPLSFVTVTVPSDFDVFKVIKRLTEGFRRLYLMRIFGKRNWEKIAKEFFKECKAYYQNLINKGYSPAKAREKVLWQIELFRRFERATAGFSHEARFKDIFRGVWKFELTYNPKEGYHPHFHGITTLMIPKLLLTVLVRRAGLGDICDIREVDGSEALVELSKYETKYWELEGLSLEEKLAVEVCLLGFQKFRNWGVPDLPEGEKEGVSYFALPNVRVRWNEEKKFIERFKELHKERSEGQVALIVDNDSALSRILRGFGLSVPTKFLALEGQMDHRGDVFVPKESIPLSYLRDFVDEFVLFVESQVGSREKFEDFLRRYEPLLEFVGLKSVVEGSGGNRVFWIPD